MKPIFVREGDFAIQGVVISVSESLTVNNEK
ncbi:MAG: hypothetical protein CM1200mP16_14600 [Nitrospina sp.]|nr:MAG: hypothetical protein CM1200mP16_14600 [Nitrospina sp.]